MRIAITGGSGFIGAHVARGLLRAGHATVVIDKRPPATSVAEWRPADLVDGPAMIEATADCDVIYHLAAVANVNDAFADPLQCVNANILGTTHVLEAARVNRVGRVIFASTVWVYQACLEGGGAETAALAPARVRHIYTASKLAGEMLCHSYEQLYSVPFTILRYGIPYGPGMRDQLVVAAFIKRALRREPLVVQGDGNQYRRFVFVKDLAEGNVRALADIARNQVYNLDGRETVTILQIARALDALLGGVKIEFVPARPGDFSGAAADTEKACRDLHWQARTPFLEGLGETLDWFTATTGLPATEAAAG